MKLPGNEYRTYPMLKQFVEKQGIKVIEKHRRTTRLYGKAVHREQAIRIYPLAFKDNVAYQTLLHEYIHLYLGPGFQHNSIFKKLIVSYGFKPSQFIYKE